MLRQDHHDRILLNHSKTHAVRHFDKLSAGSEPGRRTPKEFFNGLLSGNPGESGTGPSIKAFGGDAFGIDFSSLCSGIRQLAAG